MTLSWRAVWRRELVVSSNLSRDGLDVGSRLPAELLLSACAACGSGLQIGERGGVRVEPENLDQLEHPVGIRLAPPGPVGAHLIRLRPARELLCESWPLIAASIIAANGVRGVASRGTE